MRKETEPPSITEEGVVEFKPPFKEVEGFKGKFLVGTIERPGGKRREIHMRPPKPV